MKFCAIIPDRGDRPELTEFCLKQIARQTKQPEKVFHIKHKPYTERVDLISRVKLGVTMAKDAGIDWCFIIENDDFYPANYFDRFTPYLDNHDFLGEEETVYYNLRNLTYKTLEHKFRSSLFTTAFRISSLNNFEWPADTTPFLDIELWKYARFKRRKFIQTGAVGIKHGLGLCGGKGHVMNLRNQDLELKELERLTDEMGFEFYKALIEKLRVAA
jgi:hypothetical protein